MGYSRDGSYAWLQSRPNAETAEGAEVFTEGKEELLYFSAFSALYLLRVLCGF